MEERFLVLGNVVVCNDYVAFVYFDLDRVRFLLLSWCEFKLRKDKKYYNRSVYFLLISIVEVG